MSSWMKLLSKTRWCRGRKLNDCMVLVVLNLLASVFGFLIVKLADEPNLENNEVISIFVQRYKIQDTAKKLLHRREN